jgi:hypothetical protein
MGIAPALRARGARERVRDEPAEALGELSLDVDLGADRGALAPPILETVVCSGTSSSTPALDWMLVCRPPFRLPMARPGIGIKNDGG